YNYHGKHLWKTVLSWRIVECKFNGKITVVTLVEEQMSPWKRSTMEENRSKWVETLRTPRIRDLRLQGFNPSLDYCSWDFLGSYLGRDKLLEWVLEEEVGDE
ncbi:hypothetical protein Tco_0281066, partial [Tanacetum coccineum]